MAAEDQDQRTLEASEKKLEDAAQRGEVATAPEMRHAVMLAAMLGALLLLGGQLAAGLIALARSHWGGADQPVRTSDLASGLALDIAAAIGPVLLALFVAAMVAGAAQGRLLFAPERLAWKPGKLMPWAGLSRLFGPQALIEFAKTLLKCIGIIVIAIWLAGPRMADLDRLVGADPIATAEAASAMVARLLAAVAVLAAAVALFDMVQQRLAFAKRMRMTREEAKQEHKENEGDPIIKNRIRQIRHERARRRMMAAVPGAAVVVTNPTHYAVALKYDHGAMGAPVVVAKGADAVALRIRELAAKHGVPVLESPPLARALHATVEIDQPIRAEHYRAVAEIISQVLRLAETRRS